MYDSLLGAVEVVEADSEFFTIRTQLFNLLSRNRIRYRQTPIAGRNIVILGGDRSLGAANWSVRHSQAFEGLGAGYFVYQVQVNVQDRLLAWFLINHMFIPDLFEQSPWAIRNHVLIFLFAGGDTSPNV